MFQGRIPMKVVSRVFRTAAGCALASLCIGCDYYKQQAGYLVTRSEVFTHHYEGSPCGLKGLDNCDLPETRYTLIHKGVKVVAHCQSWDVENNKCGQLQVGEAYDCQVEGANDEFGPQMLSCKDKGVLGIEHSEKK
jgi:hypothetical protein